ncbi:hypothetical protein C8R47DRAFT_289910 [Mycena vitilis]|nr:hypothetical protein C8R47DRAFT_289910 [Mycena vitilis]
MARALSWMLSESQNPGIITAVFRALAGLPANTAVQDELFRGGSMPLLLRLISTELGRSSPDTDLLRAWLYALLHFVQSVPANPKDRAAASLNKLFSADGALRNIDMLPLGVRDIAACVAGALALLFWSHIHYRRLFDTEIPVMIKVCGDTHLQRLLIKIHSRWRSRRGTLPTILCDLVCRPYWRDPLPCRIPGHKAG